MTPTAAKYWHIFTHNTSLGEHCIEALQAFIAALTSQRQAESVEAFLASRPQLRARVHECEIVIQKIEAKMETPLQR